MTEALSPPSDRSPEEGLDEDSLAAIRSILTEEATQVSPEVSDPIEREKVVEVAPLSAASAQPPRRRKADAFPTLEEPTRDAPVKTRAPKQAKRGFSLRRKAAVSKPQKPKLQQNVQPGRVAGMLEQLKGYRPKPLHVALAVLALALLMRPWVFIGLGFVLLFIVIGVYLMVGYDGFWKGAMKIGRWYASRRPERAAQLHARLDRFAMRWDAVLDRFPEGSVDALYLPDFGELEMVDKRHDAAMERRLAGLQESGS